MDRLGLGVQRAYNLYFFCGELFSRTLIAQRVGGAFAVI